MELQFEVLNAPEVGSMAFHFSFTPFLQLKTFFMDFQIRRAMNSYSSMDVQLHAAWTSVCIDFTGIGDTFNWSVKISTICVLRSRWHAVSFQHDSICKSNENKQQNVLARLFKSFQQLRKFGLRPNTSNIKLTVAIDEHGRRFFTTNTDSPQKSSLLP